MTRPYKEQVYKQSSCDGKQPLTKAVADRISKQSDHQVVAYRCRFCSKWHVGSQVGKVQDFRKQSKGK